MLVLTKLTYGWYLNDVDVTVSELAFQMFWTLFKAIFYEQEENNTINCA